MSQLAFEIADVVRRANARGSGSPLTEDALQRLQVLWVDGQALDWVPVAIRIELLTHLRQNVLDGTTLPDGLPMALDTGELMTDLLTSSDLPAEAFAAVLVEPLVWLATTTLDRTPLPPQHLDRVSRMVAELVFVRGLGDAQREAFIRTLAKALFVCGPKSAAGARIWEYVTWSWRPNEGRWFTLASGIEGRPRKVTPLVGVLLRLLQSPFEPGLAPVQDAFHVSGIARSSSMADDFLAAFLWLPRPVDAARVRLLCAVVVDETVGAMLDPRWPAAELIVDRMGESLQGRTTSTTLHMDERLWYIGLFGLLSFRLALSGLERDVATLGSRELVPVWRRLGITPGSPPKKQAKKGGDLPVPAASTSRRALQVALLDSLSGACAEAEAFRAALWQREIEVDLNACAVFVSARRCAWPCCKRGRQRGTALAASVVLRESRAALSANAEANRADSKPPLTPDEMALASWFLAISRTGGFQWYLDQDPWTLDPASDACFPSNVVKLRAHGGGVVYLVGSCHISRLAADYISLVIRAVQPHAVCIELDHFRVGMLKNVADDNRNSRVAQEGVDMRRAAFEGRKLGAELRLVDRDLRTTFLRAWSAVSCWQRTKFCAVLLLSQFAALIMNSEDLERSLRADKAAEMDDFMTPALRRVVLDERNVVLAYNLQLAAKPDRVARPDVGTRVVAVVGAFHVPGVAALFGRVTAQEVVPLVALPPRPTLCACCLGLLSLLLVVGALVLVTLVLLVFAVLAVFVRKVVAPCCRCC